MESAIARDHTWYAQTVDLRQRRFEQWLRDPAGQESGN
jgi:hypothetical protein